MRYKRVLGYILILFLVISNVFNYNTSAQYRTEFNLVSETIMAGNNEIKDMEVLVSYIDIETNEKVEEDELITKKVGEEVIGEELKKDIINYSFEKAEPEKIIVSKESKEIKLYYKKDEVIPGEKYVDVTIHHYLIDSTEELAEDDVLKQIKVGTKLEANKYLKNIEGYEFKNAEPKILEVTEENTVISLYYDKKEVPPVEDKYVDVAINYFIENTTTAIREAKILKDIKVGTIIISADYKEDITDYIFVAANSEKLEVSEENKTINLYYKNDKPEEEKYVDVTVRYLDKEENDIEGMQKLENVEIGTVLKGRDYIKDIGGYDFNYSFPETLEVRKDNTVIKLYYDKKDVIEPVEYVDVTVNYLLENTTTSIIESKVLKDIKIGSIINGVDYKKDINDYTFVLAIPEKLEVSEENKVINLYYRKNETPSEDEFTNVTVNHLLTNTDTRVEESDILENIKISTILFTKDYIKSIKGYEFDKVLVESLEIAKDNNVINIYYKKVDTSKPVDPEEPGGNNKPGSGNDQSGNDDLPETGGRNIIWLGYIFVLLGVIISSSKKEEYAE